MRLRGYQEDCLTEWWSRVNGGDTRVPFVLATGLGKTQIFTTGADRWLDEHPGQRVLIIAHTNELIEQAAKRARQVAPRRRIGIVKAAQNDVYAEIIVSSRQTLASARRRDQLKNVGLIIIDEAHHAVRANTYGTILDHFGAFDSVPAAQVVGFTATLVRSDKAKLSSVWQDCTFSRDIIFGIRNGYLLDVRGERIIVPDFDMGNVKVRGGDYSEADLGEELERTFAPEIIAKEYARLATFPGDHSRGTDESSSVRYRKGIAFWPLVATAFHGAQAFEDQGIPSAVVHGGTPKEERRRVLRDFHEGRITVVHNAMVLTEGFDEPTADVVVIARPTRAAGLYQQMVGRVLRPDLDIPADQRRKALILDVTGAGEDHDLRTLIDLAPERPLRVNPDDDSASLLELDEYLIEIEEELDEQRAGGSYEFDSPTYAGPVATKAFDPLGRDKVWGRTPAGHHYMLAGGSAFVFLIESNKVREDADAGTYDVVLCSKDAWPTRYNGETPAWQKGTEHRDLPLDMALNWAEELAVTIGGVGSLTLTARKSKWRREAPTDGMGRLANVYKIKARDEHGQWLYTKGELSEAIGAAQAALRIDPLVTLVTGAQARG